MHISAETLDDLLRNVIERLLKSKNCINPSRGAATELIGVLLHLTNPRARLSRTEKKGMPFSCLGELLWYLSGSSDLQFISYYLSHYEQCSEDGQTVYGGYGPRLLNMRGIDQIKNVLSLLRGRDSRRAVIQLFNAEDIAEKHMDIPCTCVLQFMVRRHRLYMITYMRSNDVFRGLPHDVFAFTMMQEVLACELGVGLGTYKHMVGSLHLYDSDKDNARIFLEEGWQEKVSMPPMPVTDPWGSVQKVLDAEREVRHSGSIDVRKLRLDPYWEDLVRLLQIYWYYKKGNQSVITQIKRKMQSRVYDMYIEKKRKRAAEKKITQQKPEQVRLL